MGTITLQHEHEYIYKNRNYKTQVTQTCDYYTSIIVPAQTENVFSLYKVYIFYKIF